MADVKTTIDLPDDLVRAPKLWMDASLAALAIAGGHRLVTLDAAYEQFDGLSCLILA